MAIGNHPVEYDYNRLRGRIVEKWGTVTAFSQAIGLNLNTVSAKLKGTTGWKMQEIEACLSLLDISRDEIGAYFFTPKKPRTVTIETNV